MEELRRQLQNTPEQNRKELAASERRCDAMQEGNRHERRKAQKIAELTAKIRDLEAAR